jgi:hypothetical protein
VISKEIGVVRCTDLEDVCFDSLISVQIHMT